MLPWGFATHVQRGFAQVKQCYEPGETCETPTELTFPEAVSQGTGKPADVRMMTGGGDDVQSYEVDPTSGLGWVAATNKKLGLVFGYCWQRADYPWISLWCCSRPDGYGKSKEHRQSPDKN